MLSKFLKPGNSLHVLFAYPKAVSGRPSVKHLRGVPKPPSAQRAPPRPKKVSLGQALRVHWELWPIVIITTATMVLTTSFSMWSSQNKVDLVYTRSGNSISRTMDLCRPTVHKLYTVNQRYEPWPQMVAVLMKMKEAEHRLKEAQEQERANC